MTRRMVDTEIWKKDWFLDLSIKQKLLVKFLYDNCDCAGIYELSYRTLRNCFNEEITKEDFAGIKQIRFISENKIYIEDFIQFQYGVSINDLKPERSNIHKGISKSLIKNGLLRVSEPLGNPWARVQDKDKDKVINKDINTLINKKPNKDEILNYVYSLGKHIAVDDFIAYYDAVDWLDKNGLPLNWKQRAINWANKYNPEEAEKKKNSEVMEQWYQEQKAILAKKGIF